VFGVFCVCGFLVLCVCSLGSGFVFLVCVCRLGCVVICVYCLISIVSCLVYCEGSVHCDKFINLSEWSFPVCMCVCV
jgi:hypothetical protein